MRISELGILNSQEQSSILDTTPPTSTKSSYRSLPSELICLVLDFVSPQDQETLAAACKVNRQWYFAATPYLYRYPKITSVNYTKFVTTISPSSTPVKPSRFGGLVKRIDLSRIVHDSRPSSIARLLHRTQGSLEEFVAPQAAFGYIALVAVGNCKQLRLLDLSLVSQLIELEALFQHIQDLPQLVTLFFPRSSIFDRGKSAFSWPPRLERFSLAGRIGDSFLINTCVPATLHELQIAHCPFIRDTSIKHLLKKASHQLTVLSINYHIPCLSFNAFDKVLVICPHLERLTISVDYVSAHLFDEENSPAGHPLRWLSLESSGNPGVEKKITPDDVFIAVAEERLSELRVVRASKRLGWEEENSRRMMIDLNELLETRAEEKGETGAGVWNFDSEYSGKTEAFRGFLK
ncbi:hypothetical protein L873DRAFT_1436079 [Choiromyces venosus 120613-1]|uniref:F-box domain-containing protein n=1 Tax=Choiromyces venosus 120613-1 TaxID=1336337 RepID=A0A3N4J7R8_9PEZI|nr:hypothetical protein L873DRAFT_1436079 [Choiromyces venosus 120613-1]